MKVFISWSGDVSRQIAKELHEWLPMVVQSIQPYMSVESIDKGTRWASSIADELDGASVGIVVLTPENLLAPWIHFEAGALAKVVDESRLAPIIFGLKPSDIGTPLSQFQVTQFTTEDVLKLLKSINSLGGDDALPEARLEKMHNALWDDLKTKIDPLVASMSNSSSDDKIKAVDETSAILEELLVLNRQQSSMMHIPDRPLSPETISMVLKAASQQGMQQVDKRRLRYKVRELQARWLEYYVPFYGIAEEPDTDGQSPAALAMRVNEIVDDLLEFTLRSSRSAHSLARDRDYREEQ